MLALPACIVTHGLGETAEGSTDGTDGSGEGTAGETEPDPSATSGLPGTTDASTSGGTDEPPNPTDGSTTSETDTEGNPACEQDPDHVRWQFSGESFSPLAGIDASFLAILVGECTVGEITVVVPETGDPVWSIPLTCSLAGQLDGDAAFAGELAPVIEMTGSVPYTEVVGSIGAQVRLRTVLDWWGMGWNGWLVLERLDDALVLDLVDAEYVDPLSSTASRQVQAVLGGASWHGGLSVGAIEAECGGSVGECNDEPRALALGWGEGEPLVLHAGQAGWVGTDIEELMLHVSATAANATPMPTCTDMPLASYALAAWAVEP